MANTFKNYFAKNANTTAQTVFTAGAGVQATVIGMTVANMTTAPVSANVFVTAGGTDYFLVREATVPVGGSLVPVGGDQKLVLEATDALKVSATANCDVIVSVLEIS
jgi:hypothetical protein